MAVSSGRSVLSRMPDESFYRRLDHGRLDSGGAVELETFAFIAFNPSHSCPLVTKITLIRAKSTLHASGNEAAKQAIFESTPTSPEPSQRYF